MLPVGRSAFIPVHLIIGSILATVGFVFMAFGKKKQSGAKLMGGVARVYKSGLDSFARQQL